MSQNHSSGQDVTNPAAAGPCPNSYHVAAAVAAAEAAAQHAEPAGSGFGWNAGHFTAPPQGFQATSSMQGTASSMQGNTSPMQGNYSPEDHESHPEGSQSSPSTIPDPNLGEQSDSQCFSSDDADPMLLQPARARQGVTAGQVAKRFYGNLNIAIKMDSTVSKRLATLTAKRRPEHRNLSYRPNLQRRGNVEAMLTQIAGEEAPRACKSCRKKFGPWTECIVLEGSLCGSCSNCWYNACGSRCTFHESKVKSEAGSYHHMPPPPPAQATAGPSSFGFQAPSGPSFPAQAPPMAVPLPSASAYPPAPPVPAYVAPQIVYSFGQWGISSTAAQIVAQSSMLCRSERTTARLQNAARELGMQIAEHTEEQGANPPLPPLATMAMASG